MDKWAFFGSDFLKCCSKDDRSRINTVCQPNNETLLEGKQWYVGVKKPRIWHDHLTNPGRGRGKKTFEIKEKEKENWSTRRNLPIRSDWFSRKKENIFPEKKKDLQTSNKVGGCNIPFSSWVSARFACV